MLDVTQRKVIGDTLAEIDARLQAASPGPAQRELRVRHGALARVVSSWGQVEPHEAQVAAMLECVLELRTLVLRSCEPPGRTTRPPPRLAAAARTTRPPPRGRPHDSGPPSSRE